MEDNVLEQFNLLLDDYKIHIQHELLFLKNKLIENKPVPYDDLLKRFNGKFNKFNGELQCILKQQKTILLQIENTEKGLVSLKNKIDNDLDMQVKYIHVIFIFTFFLNIFATTMIIQFY